MDKDKNPNVPKALEYVLEKDDLGRALNVLKVIRFNRYEKQCGNRGYTRELLPHERVYAPWHQRS